MNWLVASVPTFCSALPVIFGGTLLLAGLLSIWFGRRALWSLLAVFVAINALAGVLQAYVLLHPAYDVLFLQPDPVRGWKHVPNMRWTWAGFEKYAAEFSVDVETNSLGFRDVEREFEKGDGVVRVALLGGSMIEAIQVPLEKTAGQLLERKLNSLAVTGGEGGSRFEVLNFGVAAYGTGQDLLVWEEYASRYDPDYVLLFLSPLALKLTVERLQRPKFTGASEKYLQARPFFHIKGNSLVREPPRDTEEFARVQQRLIENEYGGKRSRRRYYSVIRACFGGMSFGEGCEEKPVDDKQAAPRAPVDDDEALRLNLRIIRELDRQVREAGARLVLVNGTGRASLRVPNLTKRLKQFAQQQGLGYIGFHDEVAAARRRGIATHWLHDVHFNELGNDLLAGSMYRWLAKSIAQTGQHRVSPPRTIPPRGSTTHRTR